MYYLFGTLMTHYGSASLNHGQRKGNVSPLQKAKWHNKIHSVVNSDAIRWSLRYYWQQQGYPVNRNWNPEEFKNTLQDKKYDPFRFIDDDVLGYLNPEAAKKEVVEKIPEDDNSGKKKKSPEKQSKRNSIQRLGALGVNRAFSLTPFDGGVTFNSKSGEKDRTSLHFIEFHNTRYQYVFGLDCNHVIEKSRIFQVLDGLMSIRKVGGHNNVFCYNFSPESIVFRWTQDSSPDIFYCFEQLETRPGIYAEPTISPKLIESVETKDIDPDELWIGGEIAKNFKLEKAHIFPGRKQTISELKRVIARDLDISEPITNK
ncbi:MAG: DevR family CRISPR-associated autoregulator [Cyanobacteria bacterium P01_F01_bin.143]